MIFIHLLRTAHFVRQNIVYERTLIMTRTLNVFKYHYWCFDKKNLLKMKVNHTLILISQFLIPVLILFQLVKSKSHCVYYQWIVRKGCYSSKR